MTLRWARALPSSSFTVRVRFAATLWTQGSSKGTSFKVVKVAPLGDPVEINVRGYELSIRKEEAAVVEVQ